MKPKEWEHIAPGLQAALSTLLTLQTHRDMIPAELLALIEGRA